MKLRSTFNPKDNAGMETDGPKVAMKKLMTVFTSCTRKALEQPSRRKVRGKKSIH